MPSTSDITNEVGGDDIGDEDDMDKIYTKVQNLGIRKSGKK